MRILSETFFGQIFGLHSKFAHAAMVTMTMHIERACLKYRRLKVSY